MKIIRSGPRHGRPKTVAWYDCVGLFVAHQFLLHWAQVEADKRPDCRHVAVLQNPPRAVLVGHGGRQLATYSQKW